MFGFCLLYILRRHLLPELASGLLTVAPFGAATAVTTVAALGSVGVGLQPPSAEYRACNGSDRLAIGRWQDRLFTARLETTNLVVSIRAADRLVGPIDLAVQTGRALTILGETGAGKSLIAQAILGNLPAALIATRRDPRGSTDLAI